MAEGTWIPEEIERLTEISGDAKLILSKIAALCNPVCYAGNQFFATRYGMEIMTVKRHIRKLKELGFISVDLETEAGNRREIRVIHEGIKNVTHGIKNVTEGYKSDTHGYKFDTLVEANEGIKFVPHRLYSNTNTESKTEEVIAAPAKKSKTPATEETPKPVHPRNVMPPTWENFAAHWIEKEYPGGHAGAEICFLFYEKKGWMSGGDKLKDWYAVAREGSKWERIQNLKKPNSSWNLRKEL